MKGVLAIALFLILSLYASSARGQSLCPDFGVGGIAATLESHATRFNSAVVLANGKIVAVGYYDDRRNKDFLVARYNSNGTPDGTFGPNGIRVMDLTGNYKDDIAMCVTVAPDGNLLVGGVSDGYATIIKLSPTGSLVGSFGTSGKVAYPILYSSVESILIGNDNTIYGVGKTFDTENIVIRRLGIRAFSQNGSPITTFGENGHYYNTEFLLWHTDQIDAVIGGDGKLLVTGSFGAANNIDLWRVIRINSDGTTDTSFGTNGVMEEGEPAKAKVEDIKIGDDGSIYLGGSAQIDSDVPSIAMVKKRDANGSAYTSYNSTGTAMLSAPGDNATISAIAVDDDGRVYAAGAKRNTEDEFDFLLAAFNADGSMDSEFGVKIDRVAGSSGGSLSDLVRLSDGSFIACGYLNGADHEYGVVVRYTSSGQMDLSFGAAGSVLARFAGEGSMRAMAMTGDGKIVTAGTYLHNGSNTGIAVARFNADGTPDFSFGTYGYARYDISERRQFVSAIHIYEDGKILIGGNSLNATSGEDYMLVKLNEDGSLDSGFGSAGVYMKHLGAYGKNNTLNNFRVDAEGRILIVGDANYLGGSYGDATLMRLQPDCSNDASFGDNGVVRVTLTVVNDSFSDVAIMEDGSYLVIGSGTVNVGGVVVKVSSGGELVETFGTEGIYYLPWADEEEQVRPSRILYNGNGKLLLGGTKKVTDQSFSDIPVLYRILSSGEVDTSFDDDGFKILYEFDDVNLHPGWLVDSDKIVIAGEMETSEGDFTMMILDENGAETSTHYFSLGEDNIVGLLSNGSGGYYAGMSTSSGIGVVVCLDPSGSAGGPGDDCLDLDDPEISKNGSLLMSSTADEYQWYKDGEVISGETDQTLEIDLLDAGIYQVEVTIGECTLYSDEYSYLITGISPENVRSISVFPNPFRGDVVVRSQADLQGTDLTLYSSQGMPVSSKKGAVGFETSLSGESLSPGVYYLRARSTHGVEVLKILKIN